MNATLVSFAQWLALLSAQRAKAPPAGNQMAINASKIVRPNDEVDMKVYG